MPGLQTCAIKTFRAVYYNFWRSSNVSLQYFNEIKRTA